MNIFKLIKQNDLFRNFEEREIDAIFDCLSGRIVKYSRGKIVAAEGDDVSEIGIVLSGTLLKFVTKPGGRREAQGTLEAGGMFGEVDGYCGEGKLTYSVVAAEEVMILFITLSTIVGRCSKNCAHHQKLLDNTLRYLAEHITSMNKDTEYLLIKSMRLKIAKLIYDKFLIQNSLNVDLGMNRNEMAEYLNVSRPSMSREMIRMREEGIIEFWKGKITIKDLDRLEKIVTAK
ncbi:MAG TPA: Crp/Fnr family transcriptional regulator [Candidatus Stercoripulliclostridium merdipullorum]|uniref:Crp/Fnr family transcriptional regulator n=1 Tax=Candidatus Stercoripulliclostridium merdipullorum TaxID=2840952 RepID=A0A9D1NC54_9FIRM|nr:Crp/Fnr family transcriptional regulator [Candidatus Stercoripulliclostridium merdipullorum]